MTDHLPSYVLISPARNEAAFIEKTIQSVVTQSILPLRWIIVSDGSKDGTDEVVSRYCASHPWIELIRMPERKERHFAGKVNAFNAGRLKVESLPYDIIGNLDTDVSFDKDYFEFLLRKFSKNPQLGVAGTPFEEESFKYDYRFTSVEHVSGQIQLFRRKCFEDIGGYAPIKTGGIDLVAVISARMKGWQTRSFLGKSYFHHRKMSSANHNVLGIAFHAGWTDFTHGCDPVWEFFRSIYQMKRSPIFFWGFSCLAGYLSAMISSTERYVTKEFIHFRKIEQRRRLRIFLKGMMKGQSVESYLPEQNVDREFGAGAK